MNTSKQIQLQPRANRLQSSIQTLADACVMCGLCIPKCPTYQDQHSEAHSPRGRIAVAKALSNGDLIADASVQTAMRGCLHCGQCEAVCPAKVEFSTLHSLTLATLPPADAKIDRWLRWLVASPTWRNLARKFRLPLRVIATIASIALPPSLAWKNALRVFGRRAKPAATAPSTENSNATIALHIGCISSLLDDATVQAMRNILSRLNLPHQLLRPNCCGALHQHAGDLAIAEKLATAFQNGLPSGQMDSVINLVPGCHARVTDLPASTGKTHVIDAMNFLAEHIPPELHFRSLPKIAHVHIACTSQFEAKSADAILTLLRRIPELQVKLLSEVTCCGAAGTRFLSDPVQSDNLRERLLAQIPDEPNILVLSSNIGCAMHLENSPRKYPLTVRHPLTIVAEQWPL
jgi:glycolate oxidase iron-sulfur subunit